MTYPNDNLLQARPDLDMIATSMDVLAAQQKFIGSFIIPDLPVQTRFGKYPYVDTASWLTDPFELVSPMGALPRVRIEFGTKDFSCEERAFEMPINREDEALYSEWLDLEQHTANAARTMAAYHREASAVALVNNASAYGTSTNVTNQWTDKDDATPIADLKKLIEDVGEKCGMDPNTIVMSKTTWKTMLECDEVVDRVKFATAGEGDVKDMTTSNFAALIGVKQVLLGETRIAKDTGGTRTYPRMWANNTVSAFVALTSKEAAKFPHWAARAIYKPKVSVDYGQRSFGQVGNCEFYTYPEPSSRSEIIQCLEWSDDIVADINCAGRLTNICS